MAFRDTLKKYRESQNAQTSASDAASSKGTDSFKTSTSGSIGSGDSGLSFSDKLKKYREAQASGSVEGWAELSINLINDIRINSGNWYDDNEYQKRSERFTNLLSLADSWRKQYAGNNEAVSYIDSVVAALSEAKSYSFSTRNYYAQWETAKDYNDYVAYQKDYEAKKNFDLEAGQKDIDSLEAAKKEYESWRMQTGTDVQEKYRQFAEQYGSIDDLDALIGEKRSYLNQAKHIQEGIALSGVSGNTDFKEKSGYVSTFDDSVWSRLTSDYGLGYRDLTYEYINNQNGIRDEIKQKHRVYDRNDDESAYEANGYDHLTEEEIATYNYYYAKEGKEAAEKYLNSIQETLNQRKATSMYSEMEDKTALELAFGVAAGLDQFKSGVKNLVNTEDDYIAQSAYQIASGMVREDLADDSIPLWYNIKDKKWEDKVLGASLGQVGYDAITTTANMAPSMLSSIAMNIIAPGSGAFVGNTMMFASAAGSAYQEALNMGYDKSQARAYSTLVGASEAGLQYLLGGIGALGGQVSGGMITKMLNGVDSAFLRVAGKLAGNMLSEGFEEGMQEVLTPLFQNWALHMDADVNWSEVAYSGLLGALTAGFMEGPSTISGEVNTYQTGKQLQAADISAQRLADIGKTFAADTVAYQLAGRVNENTGAYTMGRLFNEIGATLTEQNVNEIAEALTAKGMDSETARKNAEALAYVVEGGKLSDAQVAVIEANDVLAEAVRTTIIDSDATWLQRTKGYNEALMALAQEKTAPKASQTNPAKAGQENTPGSDTMDSRGDNGSEDSSEADTSSAKVASIASIGNGNVTIKLEDGSEVDSTEADLDPEDGVIIETIAKIGGISVNDANYILSALKATPGVSPQVSALGATEAYKYGFYGMSEEHMTKHGVFANSLTDTQRKAIYETGRNASKTQVDKKQEAVSKKETTTQNVSGKVHFDGDRSRLTERQSASLTAMEKVAEALGVQIHVFESKVGANGKRIGANGWYDPRDNSIHIDLHAGANGEGTMLFTLAHELTHHIRKWSPAKFKILADFLMQEYGKKGVNVDGLIREQMNKAKRNGRTISYDTAYEEVVADSMEMMLSDGNVMKRLEKLKAKDMDLWQKIKSFIDDLADKIRKAYKGLAPDSVEGRYVADMGKVVYKLQELFTEALVEASENYQSSEQVLSQAGIAVDSKTDAGSIYSVRDVLSEKDRNKVAKALTERFGVTDKEAKEWLKAETSLASLILNPKYSMFLDYEADPNEVAIKQNSDYPQGTVDFSNICKKRREFTQVMNRILRNFPNHVFAATDLARIRTIMGEEGMTLPCGICYVEDRRQLDTIVAQDFIEGLRLYREGSKTRPDGKPFNANQLKGLNLTDGDTYVPTIYELVSLEGRNSLKAKNPNMEAAWVKYNNARGMQSVRLLTNEAEYKRQILKYTKNTVKSKNDKGGLRIYSFSDMEMFHLIDIIQVITDSAAVGLTLQGYTKVNEYAKAVKDTGEKLNRSLIPKGDLGYHMENGKVVLDYDTVEGIDIYSEDFFDNKDNPNVGNITIGINDTQIRAAMVSDFVDQIIPFHTGQSEEVLGEKGIAAWDNYKDFQTEKDLATGKTAEHQINIYTEVFQAAEAEGKPIQNKRQFVEKFLQVCKENGLKPRFAQFLNTDANGDYVYTEGYHKFLVDFKTFAQTEVGEYLPQMPVKPIFDDAYLAGLLEAYVKEQRVKDAEVAKQMTKVIERITNEIIKPDEVKYSFRGTSQDGIEVYETSDEVKKLPYKERQQKFLDIMANEYRGRTAKFIRNGHAYYATFDEKDVSKNIYGDKRSDKKGYRAKINVGAEGDIFELVENAKYNGSLPENGKKIAAHKGVGYWDYFIKNVQIDGTVFNLTANVRKKADGAFVYSIQLNENKKIKASPPLGLLSKALNGVTNASANNVAQQNPEVKKFSVRDTAPIFYSHMARVVDGVKQEKLGASSVVNMLRGKGVKAEEIKWSGIEDFLEGKKSVTKAELQEFIAGSMLQIEEDMLTDQEIPYSQEQLDQISKYEAERDTIAENLKSEWKRIVGTDIPITYFGAGLESAVVQNLLEANATKKGNTEAGYKYKAKRAALQRVIEDGDHYFGFDNARQAFREAVRNPNDFMKSYEMTSFEESVFRDFIKAKEAYNKVEGISMQDQKALKAIAESADRFSSRILKVKNEHRAEAAKYLTKYRSYTIKGGTNYRELLFRIPGSTYSNNAMDVHWDRSGVLAHARIQDLNTFLGKMLFVEEIQSDWHNEGHKSGYTSEADVARISELEDEIAQILTEKDKLNQEHDAFLDRYWEEDLSDEEYNQYMSVHRNALIALAHKQRDLEKELYELSVGNDVPDAPFRDTYHEYVLKRLIRMAAEQDYDSIGWTTAQIQSDRWSDEFAEGYRIEYDQDIPKFLNKYGKKWGTRVGKTVLDSGTEVWSMAITDSMKESVLTEGQPLYQDRPDDSVSNRSLLANAFEGVAQNDIERQKVQEYKGKISLINSEERKLQKLNEQIKELSFAKGPKDTKKIRELQFEAQQTANRINTYDKQLLRLEASKPLQDVLTREKRMAYQRAERKGKEALAEYKEKAAKTQRELLDRYQASRKQSIENRHRTEMRHKIKDVVNELNQYLLQGNKDKRVMMPLKKAVAEALDAVNMDTVGAEERIAKMEAELLKAKTPEKIQEISRKIDHIRQMGDKMNNRLKALKDAYREIADSDDPLIANAHDEVIEAKLESVIEKVGNTPLRDMNLEQLSEVYDMYRMVLTTIRNSNKAFKAAKSESISVLANRVMEEVEKVGGKRKYNLAAVEAVKKFGWNNLKPVYAFQHIGSDTFTEIFNNVRTGEDVWALDVTEAREYYLDKSKKYKYDSWNFDKRYTFKSASGMDFSLNLEQIMSLYAYSKRDQAADHLKRGGIVIDETTEITVKTKLGIPVKFNPTEATAYNISDETLAEIVGKLTDEQKGFVDEMQDYLSTVMGNKGNEVSLELYGIKLFKEKFYFPLKSAGQFMAKAKEQQQGEVKIKNSGFSKETVKKANNPIVLTPFMNVWTNHVNEMSMYHAFVLPMEDFYRVYNYRTPTSDSMATESVEMFIQNAYGKGATGYIDQLLKDLNGGARTDSTTGIINKGMGLFKKGAVFASLSVVVQQPSAIARAAAIVDTKYFIGPKVDHKRHKALWNEVKQYAPVAIIKEMGYFDTNMGKSTQDFILGKEYSGIKAKMKALVTDSNYRDEILSKAPALADEMAWCSIWEAVKREMHDKHKGLDVKSEPFLMLAGARFTEVITKTQVYDSVLARSANMRSKDTGMKMATAFMGEPTTSINMIADALLQGKRGDRKYARTAIGAVIASQILNSILVSFVYAGRDDDEDETYLEKYIGTLTGEIWDSLNPAGYIPFIKDIQSIVKGYDVERSDMAVISDLWNAWQNLSKDSVSTYRKVEGFVGSICQLFGLPVKNIMRDVRGIYQTIMSFQSGQQATKAGIGYAVKGAITGETVKDQQQLYEAYLSGDKEQIARVERRYKDQSAINSAIRKALRENDPRIAQAAQAKFSGDLDEYMRLAKAIIAEKHFSQDDVVAAINAEINALDKGETTASAPKASGLFKAADFAVAIAQGDQAMANAIKTDIIKTAQKNGKTQEEAEKSFRSSAKSELKELFLAGEISEEKAISALVTHCAAEEEDAMADVQYWAFKQAYPNVYADDSWFDAYYENVASSGMSIDVYMEYRNTVKDITGDGKKERRMAVIDSLPITAEQKDALYYAEGWAASRIWEAPWH